MGLKDKQKLFVNEYLIDLNATKAAQRAGYSKKTSYSIGHENLRKPEIQAYLSEKMAERSSRTEITQDNVIKELAKLGFSNMLDYMTLGKNGDPVLDFSKINRDQAAALTEVTVDTSHIGEMQISKKVKFKLADKRAALVDIGRHLGIFKEDNKQKTIDIHDIPMAELLKIAHDPTE